MAWTAPKTWTNEPLVAADMNAQFRDNFLSLAELDSDAYTLPGNNTTTSASYTDVDANMNLSVTLDKEGDVLLTFHGFLICSGTASAYFRIRNSSTQLTNIIETVTTNYELVSMQFLVQGLAAGTHDFDVQWYVSTGTLTLHSGAHFSARAL